MKILIVKPSSLGDIIHGLQVAQSIKSQLPGTRIDWVVKNRFQSFVEACSVVDRVHVYYRSKGFGRFMKLLRSVRSEHYDYVFDFQGLLRTGLVTFASRADHKIGRSDCRELAHFFYQGEVSLPDESKRSHAVDVLLQFLPILGLEPKLHGAVPFKHNGLSGIHPNLKDKQPIVLFPNSRKSKKEWPHFKDLAQRILEKFPEETLVWDSHINGDLGELEGHPNFFNTAGNTSLEDLIAIVANSKLCVANDSGPMHLSAAMQKPTLALFGPTPVERFSPYPLSSDKNFVLQAPNKNIKSLSTDAVFAEIEEILAKE